MKSKHELENQRLIFKQLLSMARQSYRASCDAEYAALRSKLEAQKSVAELQVRLELCEQELGIERPEQEMTEDEANESARADCGDSIYKQMREEKLA